MRKVKRGRLAFAAVSASAVTGVGLAAPAAHALGTVVSVTNDTELTAALNGQTAGEEIEVQAGTYMSPVAVKADSVTLKAVGAVARHLAEAAFHVLSRQQAYRDPTTATGRTREV